MSLGWLLSAALARRFGVEVRQIDRSGRILWLGSGAIGRLCGRSSLFYVVVVVVAGVAGRRRGPIHQHGGRVVAGRCGGSRSRLLEKDFLPKVVYALSGRTA